MIRQLWKNIIPSGSTLVKETLQQHLPPEALTTSLPSMSALVRSTKYQRQNRRPKHPTDVNFQWVEEAVPSAFVKEDMNVGTARHVILFTTKLTWYVDATFKAVKRPFYQLWGIHAFNQLKDTMKQVPLLFVLLSCRMKDDYINIFQYLRSTLNRISVQCVVMTLSRPFGEHLDLCFHLLTFEGAVSIGAKLFGGSYKM